MVDPKPWCGDLVDPETLSERARARRDAILDAGRELFLEKGYAATSLAEIVARSGGSLATVYELFGSKRGLFEAILVEFSARVMEPFATDDLEIDPERGLTDLAHRYLAMVLEPKIVGWWRTMLAEAAHVPELREIFLGCDGGPLQRAIAGYLERLRRRGQIELDDASVAAGQFLELVRGPLHRRALVGEESFDPREIERHVQWAVRLFLYGCAASTDRRKPVTEPEPAAIRS